MNSLIRVTLFENILKYFCRYDSFLLDRIFALLFKILFAVQFYISYLSQIGFRFFLSASFNEYTVFNELRFCFQLCQCLKRNIELKESCRIATDELRPQHRQCFYDN